VCCGCEIVNYTKNVFRSSEDFSNFVFFERMKHTHTHKQREREREREGEGEIEN
jgi:hypothetical protein